MAGDLEFKVIKDYGSFGDGKWQKHLTYTQWGDNEPKYDIRPWNEDMTKMGKGITLDDGELYDLSNLLNDVLEGDDPSSDSGDGSEDDLEEDDFDESEDEGDEDDEDGLPFK